MGPLIGNGSASELAIFGCSTPFSSQVTGGAWALAAAFAMLALRPFVYYDAKGARDANGVALLRVD